MFFRKKNEEKKFPQENLRRRFHQLLLSKKRGDLPTTTPLRHRQKNFSKILHAPQFAGTRKFFSFVLIGGILLGFTYTALFSSFFTIKKVSLEKNGNAVSVTSLSPFLDQLKDKNILFVRTDALTKEIEQAFKNQILLVRVKKSYPRRVTVKVDEYPAVLNLTVITPAKSQKLILNQIGYIILENAEQKDLSTLIWRTDKPIVGKGIAIPPEILNLITESFSKFQTLFAMRVPEGEWKKTERELHLRTEKNFAVWLDLTTNIEHQLMKLKRSLPKLDIYRDPLEYIDLRISGGENEKVILKRRK